MTDGRRQNLIEKIHFKSRMNLSEEMLNKNPTFVRLHLRFSTDRETESSEITSRDNMSLKIWQNKQSKGKKRAETILKHNKLINSIIILCEELNFGSNKKQIQHCSWSHSCV